jgi:hypothetical protein
METQANQVAPNQPKVSSTGRLIVTVLGLVSLAPWLLAVYVSFFAFDAPGSEDNSKIWAVVIAIWTYPIQLFLFMFIAHFLYRAGKRGTATLVQALPMIAAFSAIVFVIVSGLIMSK